MVRLWDNLAGSIQIQIHNLWTIREQMPIFWYQNHFKQNMENQSMSHVTVAMDGSGDLMCTSWLVNGTKK